MINQAKDAERERNERLIREAITHSRNVLQGWACHEGCRLCSLMASSAARIAVRQREWAALLRALAARAEGEEPGADTLDALIAWAEVRAHDLARDAADSRAAGTPDPDAEGDAECFNALLLILRRVAARARGEQPFCRAWCDDCRRWSAWDRQGRCPTCGQLIVFRQPSDPEPGEERLPIDSEPVDRETAEMVVGWQEPQPGSDGTLRDDPGEGEREATANDDDWTGELISYLSAQAHGYGAGSPTRARLEGYIERLDTIGPDGTVHKARKRIAFAVLGGAGCQQRAETLRRWADSTTWNEARRYWLRTLADALENEGDMGWERCPDCGSELHREAVARGGVAKIALCDECGWDGWLPHERRRR